MEKVRGSFVTRRGASDESGKQEKITRSNQESINQLTAQGGASTLDRRPSLLSMIGYRPSLLLSLL